MTMQRSEVSRRDWVKKSLATAAVGMGGAGLLASEAKASIDPNTMSIIIAKGSLDCAFSPFVTATTAAAMGLNVTMFFTADGLPLLMKDINKHILSMGNSATMFQTKKEGWATIEVLRDLAVEADVRLIACQMTLDQFGYSVDDMIEGIEIGGMATWVEVATQSHINLHV